MVRFSQHAILAHISIIALCLGSSPASYAARPTDQQVGNLTGTLYTSERQQRQCTILVTDEGIRYEVSGINKVTDGARATLTGKVMPQEQPACGVPLKFTVNQRARALQAAQLQQSPRHNFYGTVRQGDNASCWQLQTDMGKPFLLQGGNPELYLDGQHVVVTGSTSPSSNDTCQASLQLTVDNYRVINNHRPGQPGRVFMKSQLQVQ